MSSKMQEDTAAITIHGAADSDVDNDESPEHLVASSIQSSPNSSSNSVTDSKKDLVSEFEPQEEMLSSESKKQAMGDAPSSEDAVKIVTESTGSLTVNDNDSPQQQSKELKEMDAKATDEKKPPAARPSDDIRRRVSGVFYAGHGRRGFVNYGPRSTTYTSRGYWRPHATGTYNNTTNSRRSVPGASDDSTHQANDTLRANETGTGAGAGAGAAASKAGNANQQNAGTDSSNNGHTYTYSFRTQVTRTFHNGAFRANRLWHGNPTSRSRSHTVTSEISSQFSSPEHATNSESAPHVSSGAAGPRTGETCRSGSNTASGQRRDKYPIIYVAPTGTISILLDKGVMIEVAVDRAVRVLCHDKFSAVCNGRGSGSCILHTKARIFQQDEKVFCNFGSSVSANEKAAVFGTQGVLFTMSHLNEAYLVSSTAVKGTLSVALGRLQFPSLDYDFTVRMFFTESQTGDQFTALCNEIVQEARYGTREDGSLALTINGIYIKQDERGDVEVNCRPRHISCSPSDGTVHVRTNMVDMAVQEDDKAFVKRGLKRVHVSRSGMVVSDGNCITSMDHFGHIVSST